jgi:catechol 2,3-dioxygenase-like lactoylglutathione lyase family enzyme
MFTKLDCPILYTKDIEKAKQYYVSLGFLISSESEKFVYLTLGDTKIGINVADKSTKFPGHQAIILQSNNIKEDFEQLKDRVAIEIPLSDLGYGPTFIFRDPDNNKILIVESQRAKKLL